MKGASKIGMANGHIPIAHWYGDLPLCFIMYDKTTYCKPNVCTIKYEDMKRRPAIELKKLVEFCNLVLDDSTLADIVTMTQFAKESRVNDSLWIREVNRLNSLLRKGGVGNWQEYFNQEQNQ